MKETTTTCQILALKLYHVWLFCNARVKGKIVKKKQPLSQFIIYSALIEDSDGISHHKSIVTFWGLSVTYKMGLDWIIGFTDTLYTVLGTTGNMLLSLIYTLYSPRLHTH
jgi:hypothetical protein